MRATHAAVANDPACPEGGALHRRWRAISLILSLAAMAALGSCGGASAPVQASPAPLAVSPRPADAGSPGVAFPWPQQIAVDLGPYASIADALADEGRIDWRADTDKARAITLAFAASELQGHLQRIGLSLPVVRAAGPPGLPSFILATSASPTAPAAPGPQVDVARLGDEGYALTPAAGHVHISGAGRIGVLNGTYRLLEHLGFSWFDPDETLAPAPTTADRQVVWPMLREVPRIRLRGFWIYGAQPIPDEFALWMRRNRLNIGGHARPALRHRLGLVGWGGGHDLLQQELSDPALFARHPQWFALVDGARRPVASSGDYFNPAFANAAMGAYFADRLVQRLEHGDLREVDLLNIWPSDNRFDTFDQSAEARALGNQTDNLLHFYATVRDQLALARRSGRLTRDVQIAGISYFLTMQAPSRPAIVERLHGPGYLHLFYPIARSWAGPIDAGLPERDANRALVHNLAAWQTGAAGLEQGVVDYHNLSSFAALALTDLPSLAHNAELLSLGREGLQAYMHPLRANPGPRALTNHLLARLAWVDLDAPRREAAVERGRVLTEEYFQRRYGAHAADWLAVHRTMAASVENASELFGIDSMVWLLLQKQLWADPFYTDAEAVDFIQRFRTGGVQDLPTRFSNHARLRAAFPGLDTSMALQDAARADWTRTVAAVSDAPTRARMQSDVQWFEATASRYRLMAATADHVLADFNGQSLAGARERMRREIDFLDASPVTRDTLSPVDQRGFLDAHRRLAGLR